MDLVFRWTAPCIAGFLLDLIFGDPACIYHPVCMIGQLITWTEKKVRKIFPDTKKGQQAGGGLLVLVVLFISTAVPAGILYIAYGCCYWIGFAVESFMCFQILATKSLKQESDKVYRALQEEGLEAGRRAVSMIVGRDTEVLDEEGVTKAAVETVAENTSDGVIAPFFYMILGGAVLGFAYKAVNTMDSMVGYKNETYRYFGTAAAKLDDGVNFFPARLSAWLMIAAAFFLKMNGRNAFRIYCRDRKNHKSPNAAQTEAVMAGALGVQLAGNAWYFGTLYEKPSIGDADRRIEREDIRRSHTLLYGTAVLGTIVFTAVKCLMLSLFLL